MKDRNDTAMLRFWVMFLTALAVLWVTMGSPCLGQTARWVKLPKLRGADVNVAAEIDNRLPQNQPLYRAVRDLDPMGNVHESCHRLSSWALTTHGRPDALDNAAYFPGGWVFIAPEPKQFTLRDVIARTRTPFPNASLIIPQFNRQPLYVLVEYSCYACGTISGIEAGQAQSSRTRGSFGLASDLLAHVRTVGILARERGYPHANELTGYVQRVEQLHRKMALHMNTSSSSQSLMTDKIACRPQFGKYERQLIASRMGGR